MHSNKLTSKHFSTYAWHILYHKVLRAVIVTVFPLPSMDEPFIASASSTPTVETMCIIITLIVYSS
jgi:hypothetical protein